MPKRNNYRLIRESEIQMKDQRELMDMMTDLVNFIKSANPSTHEEDVEIQMAIKIKKNNILNHHMFEEFKEKGFAIQDDVLKLSDWSKNLKEAAASYMSRKSTKNVSESNDNPIRTMEKVKAFLKDQGENVSEYKGYLTIDLPEDATSISDEHKELIQQVIKMSNGNMVSVKTSTGYRGGNDITFIFPIQETKLRKAYHVASAIDVDSILQNGLSPTGAREHSDQFGSGLGNREYQQTYKAVFVVGSKLGVKKVQDLFNIKDPVVLEIDPTGIQFWEDPLMQPEAKSALSFDKIPGNKIKRI